MTIGIAPTDNLQACLRLRRTVFIDEQGVPETQEIDAYDDTALHLLASDNGIPVGTARIIISGKSGKIGRVCVLKSHRGTGLGKALILGALDQLRLIGGMEMAVLGAQTTAIGFYQNLGFVVVGDEFIDAGIQHINMERAL